jgi:sarcosine oxidase
MRCVVVGAGAWGLPTAAELAARGHDVTLIDRFGVGNAQSSSSGPTRLWRLPDGDPVMVRLSLRSVDAMRRLEDRSGATVFLRRGLLWRADAESGTRVRTALDGEDVPYVDVAAADVGRFFPGLSSDGRDALWQKDAGPVLAAASLTAQLALFGRHGGRTLFGATVRDVDRTSNGLRVNLADASVVDADAVVLAPGPGAVELLPRLGVDLALRPVLEQVVHLGDPARPHLYDDLPCLLDGATDAHGSIYAMPTPGRGYKAGLDVPLRDLTAGDEDRTPDAGRTREVEDWARLTLPGVAPTAVDAQVCSWTNSPDGRWVLDSLGDGIVVACGDSGVGFKYSALMGLVLADLAEGRPADPDVASFSRRRFSA